MQERPQYQRVGNMLVKALRSLCKKDRPALHSGQDYPYPRSASRSKLREQGITQNISRQGNCVDNAAMKSVFATPRSA